jgi:hypothetical protein
VVVTRRRLEAWLLGSLVLAQAVVLLGAYRTEHDWGDDFAGYVLQAEAFVAGRAMADTGYVFSPRVPIGPPAYPPGTSLLMAPFVAVWGADVGLLKLEFLAIHLTGLALLAVWLRRELEPLFAAAAWAVFACGPFVMSSAARIQSDLPFAVVCTAVWLVLGAGPRESPGRLFALGLLTAAATSIRLVGVLLAAAVVLADLVRRRRLSRRAAATVAGAAGALVISTLPAFRGASGYAAHFVDFYFGVVAVNLRHYALPAMESVWPGPAVGIGGVEVAWLWLLGAPFAVAGFVERWRRSDLVLEAFAMLMGGVLLLLPFRADARYLLPLLPLACLYGALGARAALRRLSRSFGPVPSRVVAGGLAAGLAVSCVRSARAVEDPWRGDYHPDGVAATGILDFVRRETGREDTIIFFKPRALALFTGRRAAGYPYEAPPPIGLAHVVSTGADWLITASFEPPPGARALVARCPEAFVPAFDNSTYRAFRVREDRLTRCRFSPPPFD